jgi:uncharacterized protein (DUF1697 family)
MSMHLGLLRAVNLGAHNKVGMADLRALLEALGMQDVRSLLQSGNVVFRSDVRSTAQLERLLEGGASKRLGLDTDFFVRTASEWDAVIAGNPFPEAARRDPSHLLVMCLKDAPAREDVTALQKAITGREVVRANGRHAYVVIEKKLGTRGTGRNWNTVLKLGALALGIQ